jgi:peptide deformylase
MTAGTMAIRKILEFPDPRLRIVASPVEQVDEGVRQLVDDLLETMYAAPGVGLASTQIDVHKQILVIDISEDKNDPLCLINPKLTELTGTATAEEGCLSVPEIYESVERAEHIRVQALDRDGKAIEMDAEGLLAVCIQHEMDHLLGKLFVDYLSPLKRHRLKRKAVKKLKRESVQQTSARAL